MRFIPQFLFLISSVLCSAENPPHQSVIPLFNLPEVLINVVGSYIDRSSMLAGRCADGQPIPTPWVLTQAESAQYIAEPDFRHYLHTCISPEDISLAPNFFRIVTQLDLSGQDLSDLDWLARFTSRTYVREVDLSNNPNLANIDILSKFKLLTRVNLSNTAVSDLKPLSRARYLTGLDLTSTPVQTIDALAGLTRLNEVYLTNTRVKDLEPLLNHKKLGKLNLQGTPVGDEALAVVGRLAGLQALRLRDTQVSNLGELVNLTVLESLDVSKTPIQDVPNLARLRSLRAIDISDTPAESYEVVVEKIRRTAVPLVDVITKTNRPTNNYIDVLSWNLVIHKQTTGRIRSRPNPPEG